METDMKKLFVKTKNVRKFTALMENLKNAPANVPKLALVCGEHGLGKTQTIMWWVTKNDAVYVRACQGMSSRWLLSEIAEELGERPFWHTQETFILIENYLKQNPKIIVVDEVDYLIEKQTVETLRDLHDRTGCPIVLIGMGSVDRKLARYKHLTDRLYETMRFEHFNQEDIKEIIEQLSDVEFTDDAIAYLASKTNQFRQIIKLLNKIEKLSKTNNIEVKFTSGGTQAICHELFKWGSNVKIQKPVKLKDIYRDYLEDALNNLEEPTEMEKSKQRKPNVKIIGIGDYGRDIIDYLSKADFDTSVFKIDWFDVEFLTTDTDKESEIKETLTGADAVFIIANNSSKADACAKIAKELGVDVQVIAPSQKFYPDGDIRHLEFKLDENNEFVSAKEVPYDPKRNIKIIIQGHLYVMSKK